MPKNKKLILSLVLIGFTAMFAIGGTYAYFTAIRTTTQNQIKVGTLDLSVNSNGESIQPFVLENIGQNGNIGGSKDWKVKNTGSLPGRLLVRLKNLVNHEAGCINDQKRAAVPDCETKTDGDLGKVITLNVSYEGQNKVSSTLATDQVAKVGTDWNELTPIVLQPGEERTVGVNWATAEDKYGNEIQGDSTSFDMDFRLIQLINGPTPTN
ncbi:hypothetical protein HGA88_01990 [Candidatus Roizmanbacteria bacterium]|nr:hypothetical protein [Candidatus Roizmanbacteria bacterium]